MALSLSNDWIKHIESWQSSGLSQAGHSPCAGSAFIFRNRAGNRLRLLLWDGNGYRPNRPLNGSSEVTA